jgi:type II secretory pathway predicted ATPase ExeA
MLLEFYGLREQPFGITPDPSYLYASRTHSEALTAISYGIADNRGFFALVAEPGMGKTTLLYTLLEELRDTTRTVLVFQTQCNSREFMEYILQELGVDAKGMGLVEMHGRLNEILFEELLAGKRFVLVVDEAQNLDDTVLETVRTLSNFETHNTKLLQIVLAGQPGLAAKLSQPRLSQLRQRISVLSHLQPFSEEETARYIGHRLEVAGYSGEPIFDAASIRLIARESLGIPRNINNLCYNSMLLTYMRKLRTVRAEIVQEAMAGLDMSAISCESFAVAESEPVPLQEENSSAPVPGLPGPAASAPAAQDSSATASAAKPMAPRPAPSSGTNPKDARPKSFLTYNAAGLKAKAPRWHVRSALIAAIVLSSTLVAAILGRSQSRQAIARPNLDDRSNTPDEVIRAGQREGASTNYDAVPQDTDSGQVLTVVAGPQQTLKDVALRYVGYFDSELSKKIIGLNPGLKDPGRLEAGQLIRIPLPAGAMKKVNDTADVVASPPEASNSLFARFVALLRDRK